MPNRDDETVSFVLMEQILAAMEECCEHPEPVSLSDLLQSFSLSTTNRALLQELAVHLIRILKRRSPELTCSEYFSKFPECAELIDDFDALVNAIQLESSDHEVNGEDDCFFESQQHTVDSEVVSEFRGGPLALLPVFMQKALRKRMHLAVFESGEKIVTEGDHGDELYVCCTGTATVTMSAVSEAASTDETVRIGSIVPGQVVGEMALMGIPKRTATVTAEGTVSMLSLHKEDFHMLLERHQEFSNVITTIIAERLGNQRQDALYSAILNGYQITRCLGRGAMAVVYDALSSTGQRVALKMMSHRLTVDKAARGRFDNEADIVAQFAHPNIPRLFERFDAFATAFMAIEYIEGKTLSQIQKDRQPLSEESILKILANLTDALEYAHTQGIIHRDVKPDNCMIDGSGAVKLMDFGVSVPIFTGENLSLSISGTPAYMAPEQLRGEIRAESDWFSLGCVAYELTTGRRLLNPKNVVDMARRFDNWDVEPLLDQIPACQPRLRKQIGALLSIDPDQRCVYLSELSQFRLPVDNSDQFQA